ncbi:MAG: zinc ribbon domain-containing protein, partial [Candidatus Limnocylindrales bacterium]
QVENDRYRTSMSNEELQSAWGQTVQYFRACPTCHQIVCIPDFDEPTGFCQEHSPRAAQIAEAQAQQAGAAMAGLANAFGVGDAIRNSMAASAAASAAAAAVQPCTKCGTAMGAGVKFCPNCGTAAAQPSACTKCGTAMGAGVKFCPNCGTAAA